MERRFTNMKSLVRGFAHAMNLVAPDVQDHHEKVAYFSYRIAEEMGLDEEQCQSAVYAALLHDVGAVVMGGNVTLAEIERNPLAIARASASILRESFTTRRLASAVKYSQLPAGGAKLMPDMLFNKPLLIGQIVQLSDMVSLVLVEDVPVLNQVQDIKRMVLEDSKCMFLPKITAAFEHVCTKDFVWMDMLYRPGKFIDFVPDKPVSLDEAIGYAEFVSMIIDFRSPFTAMHSAGVAASAERLAYVAGMSEDECKMMRIAGNLHDVGKLKTPTSILEKPGKLTDEEFNVIKEHAYYSFLLLQDIDGFDRICSWGALHHEKLNGKGYPFGLEAHEIPLGARIMAVSDVFSALTEERPYRKGMPKEKVISILRENAVRGDLASPIVELLVSHFDEVDAVRDAEARDAGARYFASLESDETSD